MTRHHFPIFQVNRWNWTTNLLDYLKIYPNSRFYPSSSPFFFFSFTNKGFYPKLTFGTLITRVFIYFQTYGRFWKLQKRQVDSQHVIYVLVDARKLGAINALPIRRNCFYFKYFELQG